MTSPPAFPPVTTTSATLNPPTGSLNVAVTGIGFVLLGEAAEVESVTVGAVASCVSLRTFEARLETLVAFFAAPAGIEIVMTFIEDAGVT